MGYQLEIRHDGLNKYRVVKGTTEWEVEEKAKAQMATWDEAWERKQFLEVRRLEREEAKLTKEAKKQVAVKATEEAELDIRLLEETLSHALTLGPFEWESLLDHSDFPEQRPAQPTPREVPLAPRERDEKYAPKLSFWDKLSTKSREEKVKAAGEVYQNDYRKWTLLRDEIQVQTQADQKKWEQDRKKWEQKKSEFKVQQESKNKQVAERKSAYLEGDPAAIEEFCSLVLTNSDYEFHESFPRDFEMEFQGATGILIVDFSLPAKEDLPRLQSVRYVASRDETVEKNISDSALNKLYDTYLYQIALRSIHDLYDANREQPALTSVVFNGVVHFTDRATGQEHDACILSIQANRDEFREIRLDKVEPKACFKQLKGVGSSKLHALAPVAPIMRMDRSDSRFVDSYDVVDGLDDSTNLAAMDWQDFEHLIREVFEKEFGSGGGEVKVTQASRDGGVDAIAFDPDPIRGGKIVIQAKRYTNPVGVTAVRDLYGTVVNEGATKGILVTTSQFGPDAYKFASDKPLTLLDGGNLLHLLERHGHKAKIDLQEAKAILAEAD